MPDFPQHAAFDDLFLHLNQVRRALSLRPDLNHPPKLARRIEHRLAFAHIAADRLLAIHVRARLHCCNPMQCVPMIRRAHEHDIEVFLLQHLTVIAVRARFLL
jgi:hypothetical protein